MMELGQESRTRRSMTGAMEPDLRCVPNPQGIWLCEDLVTTEDRIIAYCLLGALLLLAIVLYLLFRRRT